jgi:hypothetical protein
MGSSLYGGSVVATCGGLICWDFKILLKGLWRWSVSLCGSSGKGTWRGLPPRDPEGYLKKSLVVDGHLYIGAPVLGNVEEGLYTRTLSVRRRGFVSMTPCVGNVVLRRKSQSTFCVSVRL